MKHRPVLTIFVLVAMLATFSLIAGAAPVSPTESAIVDLRSGSAHAPLGVQSATFTSTKDTYASEGHSSNNYGGSTSIEVGGTTGSRFEAFLQFDLSSLPAGSVVSSATLRLSKVVNMASQSASPDVNITINTYAVTSSWAEYSLTWSGRPSSTYVSDPGTVVGATAGYHYWDVTNAVDGWLSGTRTNYGLRLAGTETGGSYHTFHTRESSASARPQLEVTYTVAPAAELTVSKTLVSPAGGVAQVGETVTYDIAIENTGTVAVASIPMVDRFDAPCFTWLDATPPEDSPQADGGIWYDLGLLNPGQSHQLQVRLTAVSACDDAWNRAGVTTAVDVHGRDVPSDLDEVTVDIVDEPTVTPTVTATPYSVVEGSCPGEVTIWASKDAWIDELDPERNHGSTSVLKTSRKSSAFQLPLLYFPLDQAAIPATMSIYSANLELSRAGNEEPLDVTTLTVRGLSGSWDEATVNWSNYGYQGGAPRLRYTRW